MKTKICPQCGRVFTVKDGRSEKYCYKHSHQKYLYGHFLDSNPRTRFDSNEYRDCGDYLEVQTYDKNGNPNYVFTIDKEFIDLISKYRWSAKAKDKSVYIINDKLGYIHNLIMPRKDGYSIDHIDRNPLNNRKSNLRYANQSLQSYNMSKKPSRNDITGVYYSPQRDCYYGYIKVNGKRPMSPAYKKYEQAVYARHLLEQLAPYKLENADKSQYINKLSEEEKQVVQNWFNQKFYSQA